MPWLFLIMIDDLNAGEAEMWKYVDDTTISEVIAKGQESCIQQMVDDHAIQVRDEGFQLKERKCKELRDRNVKRSHVVTKELLLFYITCIWSTLEYGNPVLHHALPSYLSEDIERLQKRAMKIIYPELLYAKALEISGILTLYDRREAIAAKLFNKICANQSHSLHKLLPSKYQPGYYLREKRTFIRARIAFS